MLQFRKALLTILVLAAVVAALVVHPGSSSASPRYGGTEPASPYVAPPPGVPDPNSGEPDSGSTRSQKSGPNATITHPGADAQLAARALRMIRWSSVVWLKHAMGLGE